MATMKTIASIISLVFIVSAAIWLHFRKKDKGEKKDE